MPRPPCPFVRSSPRTGSSEFHAAGCRVGLPRSCVQSHRLAINASPGVEVRKMDRNVSCFLALSCVSTCLCTAVERRCLFLCPVLTIHTGADDGKNLRKCQ